VSDAFDFLQSHPRVQFVTCEAELDRPSRDWSSLLKKIVPAVSTPWYWLLSPEAVASDSQPCSDPAWFQLNSTGHPPALVAAPWGYSKPANILEQLDRWGDRTELQAFPELALPFDATSDRIRHNSIAGLSFLSNTTWTQMVAGLSTTDLPSCNLAT